MEKSHKDGNEGKRGDGIFRWKNITVSGKKWDTVTNSAWQEGHSIINAHSF